MLNRRNVLIGAALASLLPQQAEAIEARCCGCFGPGPLYGHSTWNMRCMKCDLKWVNDNLKHKLRELINRPLSSDNVVKLNEHVSWLSKHHNIKNNRCHLWDGYNMEYMDHRYLKLDKFTTHAIWQDTNRDWHLIRIIDYNGSHT